MASSSARVSRRPNCFGGTDVQTFVSRNASTEARRSREGRALSRRLRSSSALRMASVFDSPVILETSSASRSTAALLMFRAMTTPL